MSQKGTNRLYLGTISDTHLVHALKSNEFSRFNFAAVHVYVSILFTSRIHLCVPPKRVGWSIDSESDIYAILAFRN